MNRRQKHAKTQRKAAQRRLRAETSLPPSAAPTGVEQMTIKAAATIVEDTRRLVAFATQVHRDSRVPLAEKLRAWAQIEEQGHFLTVVANNVQMLLQHDRADLHFCDGCGSFHHNADQHGHDDSAAAQRGGVVLAYGDEATVAAARHLHGGATVLRDTDENAEEIERLLSEQLRALAK